MPLSKNQLSVFLENGDLVKKLVTALEEAPKAGYGEWDADAAALQKLLEDARAESAGKKPSEPVDEKRLTYVLQSAYMLFKGVNQKDERNIGRAEDLKVMMKTLGVPSHAPRKYRTDHSLLPRR